MAYTASVSLLDVEEAIFLHSQHDQHDVWLVTGLSFSDIAMKARGTGSTIPVSETEQDIPQIGLVLSFRASELTDAVLDSVISELVRRRWPCVAMGDATHGGLISRDRWLAILERFHGDQHASGATALRQ